MIETIVLNCKIILLYDAKDKDTRNIFKRRREYVSELLV